MERKTMSNEETKDYVDGILDQLDATRMKGLEKAKELQQINQTQMESELKRLVKKYGPDHTRVQKMKARMDLTGQMAAVIDQQIKVTKIKTEPFDADSWRIQGFVSDTNDKPLSKLSVTLAIAHGNQEGEKSQVLSETDENGFYSITLGEHEIKNAPTTSPQFLMIFDGRKLVYESDQRHTPVKGIIDMEDVVVDGKGKTVRKKTDNNK